MTERITAAAVQVSWPHSGDAIYQARSGGHTRCIAMAREAGYVQPIRQDEQGFVTSTARFVGRFEAKMIAIAGHQLRPGCPMVGPLYAEDIEL